MMGWLLMTTAMMLPTILPLIRAFDRMVAGRSDGVILRGTLIVGYLAAWGACGGGAWGAFGGAAYALDWALHASLNGWVWLTRYPWLPSVMVLTMAGGFQFS